MTLLLTPWQDDWPFEPASQLAAELVFRYGWERIELGGADIDRVRSWLASAALATDHDWWVWLDHDNGHSAKRVNQLVEDAQSADLDALYAIVPCRHAEPVPNCNPLPPMTQFPGFGPEKGDIWEIRDGGLALAVTHRRVFERLAFGVPERGLPGLEELDFPESVKPLGIDPARLTRGWPFFLPLIGQRKYFGEDMSFCMRARFSGSRLWADTRMVCWHLAPTRVYGLPDLLAAVERQGA